MIAALEWGLVPVVLVLGTVAAHGLYAAGLSAPFVTTLVVVVFALGGAILERLHPEREDWVAWDQPLRVDALHYFLNNNLGIALGYGLSAALTAALHPRGLWPTRWPLVAQLALGVLVSELLTYWQHRAAHRWDWLWRFHALHHSGARLNLIRAGRFHFVDIGTLTFATLFPLQVLGAPEHALLLVSVVSGLNGVLTHANVRMRTPGWLDRLYCTPAVHRHHHSADLREGNENFGTTLVLFDQLFGTWRTPTAPTPEATGILDDPTPPGFLPQVLSPFRRS